MRSMRLSWKQSLAGAPRKPLKLESRGRCAGISSVVIGGDHFAIMSIEVNVSAFSWSIFVRLYFIGTEGQVARSLREAAKDSPDMVFGCGARPDLDILHQDSVEKALLKFSPDIVVNPAAYTAVDRAETEPD